MTFFDETKSIIENLDLLSGPVLALLGFFIFRQVKLAKEQLKIAKEQLNETHKQLLVNSRRDSIKLAAEQVRFYMDVIVKYADEGYDKMKETGMTRFIIDTTRFIRKDILDYKKPKEVKDYLEKTKDLSVYDLKTMNALESFSTYFIQKVADEKVAFQSVGKSFCVVVHSLSFALSMVRHNESSYFENTITLYRLWKHRIDQQNLESQKELLQTELMQKIEELETKINNTPPSNIKPLGTE